MQSTANGTVAELTFAVSVVVPTNGDLDLLDRSLDALTRQDFPAGAYEVIIVDDDPDRNTLQLVAGWRARTVERGPRLVYLANEDGPHGPGAARNRGWRAARAQVIAFTGDDTVPSPAWLSQGMAALDDQTDVLCGRIDTSHSAATDAEPAGFSAANCFCRVKVLEALDGFDERFAAGWREHADMHFRLLEMNARIGRAPQALVTQPVQRPAWGASLFQLHAVAFDALLYKKHPALYRQKIRRLPCWEDYATVAALLMAGLGLGLGQEIVAVIGAGTWLVLTGMLCVRRLHDVPKSAGLVAEVLLTSPLIPPLAVFWRLVGAIKYRVGFA